MSATGRATQVVSALYSFFGGFSLPAYAEGTAPKEAVPPYITVQLIIPETMADHVGFFARVWYRSQTFEALNAKVDEISAAIGEGTAIPTEDGAVWLYKDDQFMQYMPFSGDDTLKCAYLRMHMQALVGE